MFVFLLQLLVTVTDSGIPAKSAEQEVTIKVTRDEFAPVFTEGAPYTADIVNEDRGVGSRVFQFSASDDDRKVSLQWLNVKFP